MREEFKKLGKNIRYYREKKGLSVCDLAKLIGKRERIMSEIESGTRIIQLKTLEKISVALNTPMDTLLDFD